MSFELLCDWCGDEIGTSGTAITDKAHILTSTQVKRYCPGGLVVYNRDCICESCFIAHSLITKRIKKVGAVPFLEKAGIIVED